jgi:hypothetical protein
MKFPGGNDLYSRSVCFGNQAVRVSGPNLKAEDSLLKKQNRAFAKI